MLAVRLKRSAFDEILRLAVHSSFVPEVYENEAAWKAAVGKSDVRLQFDPDYNPSGAPVERRAIQLGLRGEILAKWRGNGSWGFRMSRSLCGNKGSTPDHPTTG